jgi:hypothetical protein
MQDHESGSTSVCVRYPTRNERNVNQVRVFGLDAHGAETSFQATELCHECTTILVSF